MSKRICYHCHKGIMRGHKVSHAKQRTKKISKPNLQSAKIMIKGVSKKVLLCTKCLRQLKKQSIPRITKA